MNCRTCGSPHTTRIGPLPDVDLFAGQRLPASLPGGALWRCGACGFVFRAPLLEPEAYAALYAGGGTEVWEPHAEREDFRRVRAAIGETPQAVLDVGCYTGDLLATLPPACRRFGVEPNPGAAARAAARGVTIVAPQWDELDDRRYDVIVSCDVIEHVPDPRAFLAALARSLAPGGRLMITTGNPEAWPWRLAGAQVWYAWFPEHISFVGPRWLQRMAPEAGLRVQQLDTFWHDGAPGLAARARALAATLVWRAAARRPRLLGGGIAPDHLFCILTKDR
jgi:SAM-dependent methyltransferase